MPPIPTGDWYLVVPIPEIDIRGLYGSAQFWLVQAAGEEEAAQIAFDHDQPKCIVIKTEYFEEGQ